MIKIFDMEMKQGEDILIEGTGQGDLLISPAGKGSFSGTRISGTVIPAGASTTYTPDSGMNVIDAPILLQTDDQVKIFMRIHAYLHLAQELEDAFLAGEHVSPDAYYYKGTAAFDVGDPKYKWLENRVFVCRGIIDDWNSLRFSVYEV